MSEKWPGELEVQNECCIIIGDSSGEEYESLEPGPSKQKEDLDCVVIDSDSDAEPFPEGKRAKVSETHSKDDILVVSDTDEPPGFFDKADSVVEGPLKKEGDSCDEGQSTSVRKETEEFTLSKYNASDIRERDVDKKPANDPKAKMPTSDTKMVADEEQPRKRKCKMKHLTGRRGLRSSPKNRKAEKHGY